MPVSCLAYSSALEMEVKILVELFITTTVITSNPT
jgi:hypothetical protein